jgi:Histidine kinase-, DNA gyrase B-, and HSP90-like ATPase
MPTNEPRNFDLNIEKILEGWEVKHAIREVIENALDEQVLSHTQDITIGKDRSGNWHIRDFGRGIHYENLTQNENPEKLKNAGKVIGKFGVGLKDALESRSHSLEATVSSSVPVFNGRK